MTEINEVGPVNKYCPQCHKSTARTKNEKGEFICNNCGSGGTMSNAKGSFAGGMQNKEVPKLHPEEESCGCGSGAGFQVPLGMKQRKKQIKEIIALNPDISVSVALSFLNKMDESLASVVAGKIDSCDYNSVAEMMREHAIRKLVESKVGEVVRKKAGGGGYVLYAPNKGKKNAAKPVATFPTKTGAKKAELARFPPKDPGKLARLRKEIDRVMKDPKKRAEKERQAAREKGTVTTGDLAPKAKAPEKKTKASKKESVFNPCALIESVSHLNEQKKSMFERAIVSHFIIEGLFREEKTGSDWDEYISKVSSKVLSGDSKFSKLQKNIEKKTEQILQNAFNTINKAVKKSVKLKSFGVKKSESAGKTYLPFTASFDNVAVEPIYIYVEAGVPKIEVSEQAKVALTKLDPDASKLFRAELVTVQERVLDKMDDLSRAIDSRDKYLERIEDEVDSFVSNLTALQVSLLKQLLVKKYRKLS